MVKPSSRQVAHEILTNYQVPYEIIINDLQEAIDNENPQFDEEAELANRKGKFRNSYSEKNNFYFKLFLLSTAKRLQRSWQKHRFGAIMGYNSFGSDMKMWPTANWGTLHYSNCVCTI